MQPREGTLDDPARAPEARAVQRPAPGELRGNSAERELVPMRLRVVSPVPLNQVRLADRSPRPPAQRRNVVDQRQQLGDVMPMSGRQARDERDALPVREEVVFAPRFTAIGWVRSSFFPSATRGPTNCRPPHGLGPSGRAAAVRPAALRGSAATRRLAARRRQQTVPDPQPISRGSMFHGMPLRRTNRMPVRTARSGIGLRPAYRRCRDGRAGRSGSIRAQSASSSNGLVMRDRLPVGHAKIPRRDQKYKS